MADDLIPITAGAVFGGAIDDPSTGVDTVKFPVLLPLLCDGVRAWLLLEEEDDVEELVEWHEACGFVELGGRLNEGAADAALLELGDRFPLFVFFIGEVLEYGLNEVEGEECIGVGVAP